MGRLKLLQVGAGPTYIGAFEPYASERTLVNLAPTNCCTDPLDDGSSTYQNYTGWVSSGSLSYISGGSPTPPSPLWLQGSHSGDFYVYFRFLPSSWTPKNYRVRAQYKSVSFSIDDSPCNYEFGAWALNDPPTDSLRNALGLRSRPDFVYLDSGEAVARETMQQGWYSIELDFQTWAYISNHCVGFKIYAGGSPSFGIDNVSMYELGYIAAGETWFDLKTMQLKVFDGLGAWIPFNSYGTVGLFFGKRIGATAGHGENYCYHPNTDYWNTIQMNMTGLVTTSGYFCSGTIGNDNALVHDTVVGTPPSTVDGWLYSFMQDSFNVAVDRPSGDNPKGHRLPSLSPSTVMTVAGGSTSPNTWEYSILKDAYSTISDLFSTSNPPEANQSGLPLNVPGTSISGGQPILSPFDSDFTYQAIYTYYEDVSFQIINSVYDRTLDSWISQVREGGGRVNSWSGSLWGDICYIGGLDTMDNLIGTMTHQDGNDYYTRNEVFHNYYNPSLSNSKGTLGARGVIGTWAFQRNLGTTSADDCQGPFSRFFPLEGDSGEYGPRFARVGPGISHIVWPLVSFSYGSAIKSFWRKSDTPTNLERSPTELGGSFTSLEYI